MVSFVGRRIAFAILIYVLIVFFVHLGMRMLPNSEIAAPNYDVGQHGRLAWQDTRTTLSRVLRGDLGRIRTALGSTPINDIVREAYVNSMVLLLISLAGATVVGLLVGAVAAVAKSRALTLALLMVTLLGISTPAFFAGLLLQLGELRYLAVFGRRLVSMAGFGWDLEHMLMPALVLAARPLAYLTRATFLSLSQALQEDYMRTAFAKGLSLPRAVLVHAARNVAVSVLTAIGVSMRFSLGTLPVVEFFFAWPGMGRRLLEAINARQPSVVVALASALGLTFLITNLMLDVAYRVVDPRTRTPPSLVASQPYDDASERA
jgi:ABC-type dipeptide/oligopeptide/nickel transport system permease component